MRCNICYLPINEEKSKENCPRCYNSFHRDHFAAWLLDHSHCPMCKEELSEGFRDHLRPKTAKERRRLEQVLSSLDGIGELLGQVEKTHSKQIMRSREEEFGLEGNSLGDYIKMAFPFVLIGLSLLMFIGLIGSL